MEGERSTVHTTAPVESVDKEAKSRAVEQHTETEVEAAADAETLCELVPRTSESPARAEQSEPSAMASAEDECVVCMEAPPTHASVPCGHRCICAGCVSRAGLELQCPICRASVQMFMRVFCANVYAGVLSGGVCCGSLWGW